MAGCDPAQRADTLNRCRRELSDEIDFQIFLQYHFFRQWRSLKAYANDKGYLHPGDLPIYVSADSAQVWAHPELFQLDENFLPPPLQAYRRMPFPRWDSTGEIPLRLGRTSGGSFFGGGSG